MQAKVHWNENFGNQYRPQGRWNEGVYLNYGQLSNLALGLFLCDSAQMCLQCGRPRFDPWVGKILWRRKWQPTPVFLPGKSHGWSLVGYSPWGRKESDTTEWLHLLHFKLRLVFMFLNSLKSKTKQNLNKWQAKYTWPKIFTICFIIWFLIEFCCP